jgi:hypothetical protein
LNDDTKIVLTNVHLPAKTKEEGYKERLVHFQSCQAKWVSKFLNPDNIVIGGDFNDGLRYKDPITGLDAGLYRDLMNAGFDPQSQIDKDKKTCGVYNIDHVLTKGFIKAHVEPCFHHEKNLLNSPNAYIPSDHIPIMYRLYDSRVGKRDERTYCINDYCSEYTTNYCGITTFCYNHLLELYRHIWREIGEIILPEVILQKKNCTTLAKKEQL